MTYAPHSSAGKVRTALALAVALVTVAVPAQAAAQGSGGVGPGGTTTGPSGTTPTGTVPGATAKLVDGKAIPPASAPPRVVRAIKAANRIEEMPYDYGGGHARWLDDGYDCSGAVSFALGKYGAKVLQAPMPSGSFARWGEPGPGKWITTYANGGHMYAVIAGLRWDTSNTPGDGPGWSETGITAQGYSVRHPAGL